MAKLRIKLEKWLEGGESQVVGSVHPVPDPKTGMPAERRRGSLRDLIIPATMAERFLSVDVEPGRYLVEVMLPSGEIVSQPVTVGPGGETVKLRGDDSPHEWMSWQHLMGTVVQSRAAFDQITARSATWDTGGMEGAVWVAPVRPLADDELAMPRDPIAEALDAAVARGGSLVRAAFVKDAARRGHVDSPTLVGSYAFDRVHQAFLFSPIRNDKLYRLPPEQRRYLLVARGSDVELLAILPIPWQRADFNGPGEVDVLVRFEPSGRGTESNAPARLRASIAVRDPVVGSVIAYLGRGDLQAASVVLKRAQDMLMEKMDNAIAAAAGAYVLAGAWEGGPSDRPPRWHEWVGNLMRYFPWLPDGAILEGWLALRTQRTREDVARARRCFLIAHRRGLPFFSLGVKMLFEGLTLFVNDEGTSDRHGGAADDGLRTAWAAVRRLALRTDPREAFTVIRLG